MDTACLDMKSPKWQMQRINKGQLLYTCIHIMQFFDIIGTYQARFFIKTK
jgi:hypothetical protein